ncbi:hypothetical protein, partial [Halomonas sp. KAO]|uniref:hypothetical protein n=1 Tax=Halomonas sp. KAO TaxID=2783858 RepID=UPI003B63E760
RPVRAATSGVEELALETSVFLSARPVRAATPRILGRVFWVEFLSARPVRAATNGWMLALSLAAVFLSARPVRAATAPL